MELSQPICLLSHHLFTTVTIIQVGGANGHMTSHTMPVKWKCEFNHERGSLFNPTATQHYRQHFVTMRLVLLLIGIHLWKLMPLKVCYEWTWQYKQLLECLKGYTNYTHMWGYRLFWKCVWIGNMWLQHYCNHVLTQKCGYGHKYHCNMHTIMVEGTVVFIRRWGGIPADIGKSGTWMAALDCELCEDL